MYFFLYQKKKNEFVCLTFPIEQTNHSGFQSNSYFSQTAKRFFMFSCFSKDKLQAKLNKSANTFCLQYSTVELKKKRSSIVNSCHFIHKHTLSSLLVLFIINEYHGLAFMLQTYSIDSHMGEVGSIPAGVMQQSDSSSFPVHLLSLSSKIQTNI